MYIHVLSTHQSIFMILLCGNNYPLRFDLQMGGCVDKKLVHEVHQDHGLMVCDEDPTDSISFSDYSSSSSIASTSSDFTDDSTSPSALQSSLHPLPLRSTSPQFSSDGPLFGLSELMAHLPIKRGLSIHYQGKSQSFTSLSNVRCTEDLAKKETPYSKKMKPCKSYGGFSDCQKSYTPKACTRIISKKASKVLSHVCNPRKVVLHA